ncbi:MAG: biopolymer transporter ExbD [Planctomycetaceae bacterium]|nr:biopolymer transporter ExbD [Planctomycetaceae bacterium]
MRIKSTQPNVVDLDMTPMIDIVFQLIAFFMIVTNFEQTQADERVKLPENQLARPPMTPRDQELYVNIGFQRDDQGRLLDPQPYVFSKEGPKTVTGFGSELQMESRVAQAKKIDPKTITVVIRADSDTPAGVVQDLIKLAQDHGFEKFALKAKSQPLDE